MYWAVTTTFCDHYNIGLQVMSPYTYEEKCAGPFPDAWTRYVYCQRVVAAPISIFTDTIDGKIKIVRADLYQESQQQLQIRKKLRSVHDETNQERIAREITWELLEIEVIDRRQVSQRRIKNGF